MTISETPYDKLFRAIETGDILPGERLLETDLAKRFGVSRTPIREAIRKLESDGIVEHLPRIGAVVRQLSQQEIVELYEMRIVLESTAAEMAAKHASVAEIETLEALNQDMLKASGNPFDVARINRHFHLCIVEAARNQFLIRGHNDLANALVILGKTTLATPLRVETVFQQHEDIIARLRDQDAAGAHAAMRTHMETSLTHRLKSLRDIT